MMSEPADTNTSIRISIFVYRILMWAYPVRFRNEFGSHMQQVFRDYCIREYQQEGLPGMFWLWVTVGIDYFRSVFYERFVDKSNYKGVFMSRQRFIEIGNWSLMLGGIVMIIALSMERLTNGPYNPYNAFSRPIDRYIEVGELILAPTAFLLLTIGIGGLYARFAEHGGWGAKISLGLSIAGGTLTTISVLPLLITESGMWWTTISIGLVLLFGGTFIFGILAIKNRLHDRSSALLISGGFYFPLMWLTGMISEALTGRWYEINPTISLAGMLITGVSLAVYGYLQLSSRRAEELSTA